MNLGEGVLLDPDLIQIPQVVEYVQFPPAAPPVPPLLSQLEVLPSFQLLRPNFGL